MRERIGLAADKGGLPLLPVVHDHLVHRDIEVLLPFKRAEPPEYPRMTLRIAMMVARGDCHLGILLGGSGQGEAVVANKVRGVRAVVGWDEYGVRIARGHQDANVLCLGARMLGPERVPALLDTFISTTFEGGRHIPRLQVVSAWEQATMTWEAHATRDSS